MTNSIIKDLISHLYYSLERLKLLGKFGHRDNDIILENWCLENSQFHCGKTHIKIMSRENTQNNPLSTYLLAFSLIDCLQGSGLYF